MKFPILASFIIFAIVLSYAIKRNASNTRKMEEEFWKREHKANTIRRKPLDNLKFISIPLETFPTHILNENEAVMECISIIENLASEKIVNFSGYSNTDLKLEYGTANLTVLSAYDQNYTLLVRTLQKWADLLIENNYMSEAVVLMEYAVSTGTDISSTYYKLADYYSSGKEYSNIDRLIYMAESLKSPNKKVILNHLKEQYPQIV